MADRLLTASRIYCETYFVGLSSRQGDERRLVLSATQSCHPVPSGPGRGRLGKETGKTGRATPFAASGEDATQKMLREDEPSRRCGTGGRLRPCLRQDLRPCLSARTGETGGWRSTPSGQQLTLHPVSMAQVIGKGSRIRVVCAQFLSMPRPSPWAIGRLESRGATRRGFPRRTAFLCWTSRCRASCPPTSCHRIWTLNLQRSSIASEGTVWIPPRLQYP
jgi:hypothetical protein